MIIEQAVYGLVEILSTSTRQKVRDSFMKNNNGLTLVELLITVFMFGIIALIAYGLIVYGNKPVSEMPIWLYWLLRD